MIPYNYLIQIKSFLIIGSVIGVTLLLGWIGSEVSSASTLRERNSVLLQLQENNANVSDLQQSLIESQIQENITLLEQINQIRTNVSNDQELPICPNNCRFNILRRD